MRVQSIRELNNQAPFKPYEIHMMSGENYRVAHPDFVLVSPRGDYVIVADARGRPHHLSALLIERASRILRNGPRRRGKRRA